jgi:hypothetical protein
MQADGMCVSTTARQWNYDKPFVEDGTFNATTISTRHRLGNHEHQTGRMRAALAQVVGSDSNVSEWHSRVHDNATR